MATLFDPSCASAYEEVFADENDTDWCCLGYEGRKLKCAGKGSGGLEALVQTFKDEQVQYALLRMIKMDDGGDSKRIKFVFVCWVGEHAPAMKKGSVTSHKPLVAELFKGHHVSRALMERAELDTLSEARVVDHSSLDVAYSLDLRMNEALTCGGTLYTVRVMMYTVRHIGGERRP